MSVAADNVNDAATMAGTITTSAGGRIDGDQRGDSAHLVLRVPDTALTATLDALGRLGDEHSRDVTGSDVTGTVADLNARIAALQTSTARLQQLLSDSGDLAALLQVETQLTQRQADLESLQAQQRALADQVALATITLDLTPTPASAPPTRHGGPKGFGGAVVAGWHGLVVALRYLAAGAGYIVPVLGPVLLIAVGLVVWRRRRASTNVTPTGGPPEGAAPPPPA